jgi:DNA-directed RNA polymerase sigma subunit (sigma70/sigma32)
MTKDELKKQLHSYRDLKAEHQQIAMELERVEAFMDGLKGTNWSEMPMGRGSGKSDPILNVVAQHIYLQERYQAKLAELAAAQAAIEDMIESLDPMERKLFRHRYIEGLTWEEVCVAIGYSWRQTHNIHGAALDKILEAAEQAKEGLRQLSDLDELSQETDSAPIYAAAKAGLARRDKEVAL